jgi:hypothetical protein
MKPCGTQDLTRAQVMGGDLYKRPNAGHADISRNAQAVALEFPKSCEIAKQLIAKYSSLLGT